ncbi:MAG: hypothetical protein FWG88_02335 [Oscillospiraceae bacterium]|nr:hypothetical protein [Oscillospiraceae bacterium]
MKHKKSMYRTLLVVVLVCTLALTMVAPALARAWLFDFTGSSSDHSFAGYYVSLQPKEWSVVSNLTYGTIASSSTGFDPCDALYLTYGNRQILAQSKSADIYGS